MLPSRSCVPALGLIPALLFVFAQERGQLRPAGDFVSIELHQLIAHRFEAHMDLPIHLDHPTRLSCKRGTAHITMAILCLAAEDGGDHCNRVAFGKSRAQSHT